jgi:D-proline reductase (dithiol) PrdB
MGIENLTQKQVVKMTTEFQRVDPELSEIPISTPRDQTRVRHGGYDIRATAADRNVSLPIDRMIELADEGVIGEFVNPVFSFVGMTSQLRLRKQIGAEWAARAKAAGAQAAVLIPI